jgi:DeoR family glycerol-3-phosphate regulon repressor
VRQRDILALIESDGAQYIGDLATRYHLATPTSRRDINALCDLAFARLACKSFDRLAPSR